MKKIKKHLKGITISIILILILSLILIKYSLLKEKEENIVVNELEIVKQENEEKESIEKEEVTELAVKNIYVDIKGAVKNPGVYEIRENKKVIDQTTPNMIQKLNLLFARKPLISKEI